MSEPQFDFNQPISYNIVDLTQTDKVQTSLLFSQLQEESNMFLISAARSQKEALDSLNNNNNPIFEKLDEPITLVVLAKQGESMQHVAIATIDDHEVGIGVLKQFCHRKIATNLLRQLIKIAEFHNIRPLWLDVDVENKYAIHLYKNFGFIVTEEYKLQLPDNKMIKLQRMKNNL